MTALYVTSKEKGSGVTSVCAALGKLLIDKGKKPGYLKPVPPGTADGDAAFIGAALSLEEPVDTLSPAVTSSDIISELEKILPRISANKDIVLIEGAPDYFEKSAEITKALSARLLIVEPCSNDYSQAIVAYKSFGQSLLGVIFNKIPARRIRDERKAIAEQLKKVGITFLGAVEENRSLYAMTIGEMAACIGGEMLRGEDKADELVESVMLGAMTVDSGPRYFGRKENKAAVLRSERPDMALAAMSTSTRCLVLTGDSQPLPVVMIEAEERGIPIITTKDTTTGVVEKIEDAFSEFRAIGENKLARFTDMVSESLDLVLVYKDLGL